MLRHLTLGLALCAALSACGGGGSSTSALPAGPASSAPVGPQSVKISIKIPQASTSTASSRRALYISPGTQSAAIIVGSASGTAAPVDVNLTPSSPNCASVSGTLTCTITVSAPVGTDTFSETLYSGTNEQGSVLSQGKASAQITAGAANTVSLTLSGVIAALSLVPSGTLTSGSAGSLSLTVNFKDAAGDLIVGPGTFSTPVTLTDTDSSGATQLKSGSTTASTLKLNQPSDAASLSVSYSGSTAFTSAVLSATAGSVSATNVTITAQPAPTATPNAAGFTDYSTFGYDNGRDVYNPNSTALTPTSVNSSLHLAWQSTLNDYNTQTQPILATEISGHAGVLYVGGGSGYMKAYDALTGKQLPGWSVNTGQETYTCENNSPIYFGVGGTAAYDPASKSIYVVGNTNSQPNAIATNTLYHLDGATGTILGQVPFAPPTSGWNSLDFSHTAVTLSADHTIAYVGTAATCDISSWRGRVVAINVPAMTIARTFFTVWNGTTQPWGGGGVWGWGGVSIDPVGNVLTGVGNTDDGSSSHGSIVAPFAPSPAEYSGYGEALIELPANLSGVTQSNHPIPITMYNSGNSVDLDLQGTPAIFTPMGCPTMAAIQGKSGTLFLYDEGNLGNGPVGHFQLAPSSYEDSFLGGPAFSEASGLLYEAVPSSSDSLFPPGLIAIKPGCGGTPTVAWNSAFGPDSGGAGSPRSVPAVSAGGVVFVGTPCTSDGNGGCGSSIESKYVSHNAQSARRRPAICCAPPGSGEGALWAIDGSEANNGAVLNGGVPLLITSGPIRVPPTVDGDWVFVMDNSGNLYGLTTDSKYPAIAEKMRAPDSRMLRHWEAAPRGRPSD